MAEVSLDALRLLSMDLTEISIGSGIDLVPSGNESLPEPILTQTYLAILPQ